MTPLISTQAREHLRRHGEASLTLQQSIALILGVGTHNVPVSVLSEHVAIALSEGKHSLHELQAIPGLGVAKASALIAALELPRLVEQPRLAPILQDPALVYESCSDLIGQPQEHLVAFFLDVRGRKVKRELVSIGTSTASIVHAREVYRAAIIANAYSLILAHNHPSGDPQPSSADLQVTKQMAKAGNELGIELIDHVIVAKTGWVSLRETLPSLFP